MKKQILTMAIIVVLPACSSIDNETNFDTLSPKNMTLEVAKKSTSQARMSGETLFRVCMDYNKNKDKPNWNCQETYLQENFSVKSTSSLTYISSHEITNHPENGAITTVIPDQVEFGFSIKSIDNGAYVEYSLNDLLSIEVKGEGSMIIESPKVIECSNKVPFTLPNSSGFLGDFCYYEYSKFIDTL
jgi:hypothetical protein